MAQTVAMNTAAPMPSMPPGLPTLLKNARRIAVLTGAGISAESGIPTFRGTRNGLWARFDPTELATPGAFLRDPPLVWAWYAWRTQVVTRAQPNAGHRALAQLVRRPGVERVSVVTQNVDDLHERAGSEDVVHLHGSLFTPRCFDCGLPHRMEDAESAPWSAEPVERLEPPRCVRCGGRIRPGVVWFGEALPQGPWRRAMAAVTEADLLLVVGTSGVVQPAAGLADLARDRGRPVVVINPDAMAGMAPGDVHWRATAAQALPLLLRTCSAAEQEDQRRP